MDEAGKIAAAENLTEQFEAFRANCDIGISKIAQQRLQSPESDSDTVSD